MRRGRAPGGAAVASLPAAGDRLEAPNASVLDDLDEAVAAVRGGGFVVVVDSEDRENEGDLILAAEHATEEKVAWMVRHTSGLLCVSLTAERCAALELPLMVDTPANREAMATAFTVSVDLKRGTSTGISAHDRAATLRALADPACGPADFNRPGHVFPLIYHAGGVVARPGHTEAAVDLARMAGLREAGVLCELVNDGPKGDMMRLADCRAFADRHGLKLISIEQIRGRQTSATSTEKS